MVKDASTKRQRSPDYPYYSLPECVKYIENLKKKEGLVKLPKKTALADMGFDLTGQTVWRASSAITGFGLLEEEGPVDNRMYQFTDIGKTIVLIKDENEPKKVEALQGAALNYEIIKQIRSVWDQGLPSSDDVIKTELIRRGFTERAAARFVNVLRETYDYARLGGGVILDEESLPEDKMDNVKQASTIQNGSLKQNLKGFAGYTLTLSKGKEIRLLTSDSLSSEDFDFMIQWIKRLGLVRSVSIKQPEVQEQKNDDEAPNIPF